MVGRDRAADEDGHGRHGTQSVHDSELRRFSRAPTGATRLAAEGVTAGAAAACVRVVDGEALLLDRVCEVDGRADQVRRAHPVDDQRYAAPLDLDVTVEGALVEEQLVLQP